VKSAKDTPRTDAEASFIHTGLREGDEVVDADFARILERENARLVEGIAHWEAEAKRQASDVDENYQVILALRKQIEGLEATIEGKEELIRHLIDNP